VVVAVVERRRDGKLHPLGGRRSDADLDRAVSLVHAMRCRDRMSYRQIAARLAEYGLRVSLGSVYAYYRRYCCERCEDQQHD